MLPFIRDILLEEQRKQEENKQKFSLYYNKKNSDYLCVDDSGLRLRASYISSHFHVILKNANLPRIRYHELRHSCASLLISLGVSMKEIQEWLGHSTYETTANIYSHLDASAKYETANALVNLFGTREQVKQQQSIMQKAKENIERQMKTERENLQKESKELEANKLSDEELDEELERLQKERERRKKKDFEM